MRYANFEVPSEVLTDFVKEMQQREIEALIVGLNDEDEIVLRVGYERDEAGHIDELEDELDTLKESVSEEEEEEEEEDDENEIRRRK